MPLLLWDGSCKAGANFSCEKPLFYGDFYDAFSECVRVKIMNAASGLVTA